MLLIVVRPKDKNNLHDMYYFQINVVTLFSADPL